MSKDDLGREIPPPPTPQGAQVILREGSTPPPASTRFKPAYNNDPQILDDPFAEIYNNDPRVVKDLADSLEREARLRKLVREEFFFEDGGCGSSVVLCSDIEKIFNNFDREINNG